MKKKGINTLNLSFINFILILSIALYSCEKKPPIEPIEIFQTYVIDPIPESVTNLKVDQPKWFKGYIYVLKFNINRDDLTKIIESRPFERAWNPRYSSGIVYWSWDMQNPRNVIVYNPESRYRTPEWFKPEFPELDVMDELEIIETNDGNLDVKLIKNDNLPGHTEVYVYEKIGDKINRDTVEHRGGGYMNTQVILYDKEKQEAYVIVSRVYY